MDRATAQSTLDIWLAAELVCANGRSFSHGERTLTHHDLPEIRAQISWWQRIINGFDARAGGSNVISAVANWNR